MRKLILFLSIFLLPAFQLMAQITKEDQINFSILTGFSIPLNNKEVIVEETSEYEYRFGEKNIKTPHHPPIIYIYNKNGIIVEKIKNKKITYYDFGINGENRKAKNIRYKTDSNNNIIEKNIYKD